MVLEHNDSCLTKTVMGQNHDDVEEEAKDGFWQSCSSSRRLNRCHADVGDRMREVLTVE